MTVRLALSDRGRIAACLAVSIILGACFIALDLPEPNVDDLFYIGASLNYATTGQFTNPYLALQQWPFAFFAQTYPTQSAVVIPWLKIFGISFWSIGGLYNLIYFGSAILLTAALSGSRFSIWIHVVALLTILAVVLRLGFRGEAVAIALFSAGLFCSGKSQTACRALSGLFFTMAAICAVRWSAVLGLTAFFVWLTSIVGAADKRNWRSIVADLALLASGAVIALAYVFFYVDYRVADVVAGIRLHADMRHGHAFEIGLSTPVVLGFAAFGAALVSLVPSYRAFSEGKPTRTIAIIYAAVVVAIALAQAFFGALGGNDINMIFGLFLVALFACVHDRVPWWHKSAIVVLLAGTIVVLNLPTAVDLAARASGRSHVCGAPCRTMAQQSIARHSGGTILIDSAAARYVFDYRLSAGTFDYYFSRWYSQDPLTFRPLTCESQRPGDIWLLARWGFRWGMTGVMPAPDSVNIVGPNWRTWISPIDETFTIEGCNARRNVPPT